MKKTKILMPLTGIAAIGAIAPAVVLTSCGNKGNQSADLFEEIGNTVDKVGIDVIKPLATVTKILPMVVAGTLKNSIAKDHHYWVSWNAKEETGKVFHIGQQDPVEIKASEVEKFEEKSFIGNIDVSINETNYATWSKGTEAETFSFDATYTEKDKDGNVVASQVVPFSFTAYPNKNSILPIVNPGVKAFEGIVSDEKGTTTINGWELITGVVDGATLDISYSASEALVLTATTPAVSTFTVPQTGSVSIKKAGEEAVHFGGTTVLDSTGKAIEAKTTFTVPEAWGDITLTLNFKASGDKYVESEWSQEITIPAKSTFTIDVQ